MICPVVLITRLVIIIASIPVTISDEQGDTISIAVSLEIQRIKLNYAGLLSKKVVLNR